MKHIIVMATLLITIVGCASNAPVAFLRGSDITASDQAPELKLYSEKMPGVGEPNLIARTFVGQPPLVPHTVDQYLPMSLEENACLNCHITDELRDQKVPQIGKSRFSTTIKKRNGSPAIEMTRFQCDSCHVPQVDAKPLVDSQFVGVTK